MEQLLRPRTVSRALSKKPSTVARRDRDVRRGGLSAANSRIKNRWRLRKYRAMQEIRRSAPFQELFLLEPSRCENYIQELDRHCNQLMDIEIAAARDIWQKSIPEDTGNTIIQSRIIVLTLDRDSIAQRKFPPRELAPKKALPQVRQLRIPPQGRPNMTISDYLGKQSELGDSFTSNHTYCKNDLPSPPWQSRYAGPPRSVP